jgi:hypothetical protein
MTCTVPKKDRRKRLEISRSLKSRIFCAFGKFFEDHKCYLQTLLICQVEFQTSSRNLKLALSFHFKASHPSFLRFRSRISISLSLFKFTWTKLNSTLLLFSSRVKNLLEPLQFKPLGLLSLYRILN